jgi:hypothetical protein
MKEQVSVLFFHEACLFLPRPTMSEQTGEKSTNPLVVGNGNKGSEARANRSILVLWINLD